MDRFNKRRSWQFGLSTLLLAMLLCGVLAWLFRSQVLKQFRQEQQIIAQIRHAGGRVETAALGPEWLDWIDGQYRQRAVTVHFIGPAIDDDALRHLERLQHLRKLWLVETAITPAATHELQSARPDLEIRVVQGFPIQATQRIER